jgi:hypothetical protein
MKTHTRTGAHLTATRWIRTGEQDVPYMSCTEKQSIHFVFRTLFASLTDFEIIKNCNKPYACVLECEDSFLPLFNNQRPSSEHKQRLPTWVIIKRKLLLLMFMVLRIYKCIFNKTIIECAAITFSFHGARAPPLVVQRLLTVEVSRSDSDTRRSVGLLWTSGQVDTETSTTHNTHKRRAFMPSAGLEPAIQASELPQTPGLWSRYTKAPTPTPTPRFLKLRLRLLHKSSLCINNGKPIRHFIATTWIIRLLFLPITYI